LRFKILFTAEPQNAQRICVFNFLPLLASRCFLAELSKKSKEKSLCDLCDSSEVGDESIVFWFRLIGSGISLQYNFTAMRQRQ